MRILQDIFHRRVDRGRQVARLRRAWNLMTWLLLLSLLIAPLHFAVRVAHADIHPAECYDDNGVLIDEECEHEHEQETESAEETSFTMPGQPAGPVVTSFTYTPNMTPLGYSARVVPPSGVGSGRFNSDLAFWGTTAYQGHYDGFRIIDVSDPADPTQIINYTECVGSQGDVAVWGNLLVRSWDAPASSAATCGGQSVGSGFEGLNIFDISNPVAPVMLRSLRMASNTTPTGCGSHTSLIVPDLARGNLYVYSMASSTSCTGIDIVRIPLSNPANAVFLRREASGRACHDGGVILGDANLIACAGGNGITVWGFDPTINPPAVGSFEDPIQLWSRSITGVTIGHSATFSWDGEVVIFGHEPGGGSQAQCQASSSTTNKSIFFFQGRTGTPLGSFVLPRPQTNTENCTWHYYNTVPTDRGYVLVAGDYQSGVSVVDFTNPAAATEIAYADPAPLSPTSIVLGGDWSSYWYNGNIYESDITRGLLTWDLSHRLTNGARTLARLPSSGTQELTIPLDKTAPTTTASLSPAAVNGWYNNPTVTFTASDGSGSGVDYTEFSLDGGAFTKYTGPFSVTGDGNHTLAYRSADFALNVESTQSLSFNIDATAPALSPSVSPNPVLLNGSATPSPNATDSLSGVASASCAAVITSGVGAKTVTCTATDNAGNLASASAAYNVIFGFSGFSAPVENLPALNTANSGQAIPLKWRIIDANGNPVTNLSSVTVTVEALSCPVGVTPDAIDEYAAGDSGLQNHGDGYYQFNWKTPKGYAQSCKTLKLNLGEGVGYERTALFQFTK